MTHRRYIGTFAEVAERVVDTLGLEVASDVVGRERFTVYGWRNPAKGKLPNVHQAMMLDAAYVRMTGEEPPFYHLMGMKLERMLAGIETAMEPTEALLLLQAAIGRLADQHRLSLHVLSNGGQRITPHQAELLLEQVAAA